MSIFGLERTPIGPVDRGFELQGQSRAGRAFLRWEAHYIDILLPDDQIAVLITTTGEYPPQEKSWNGLYWSRSDFDPVRHIVWYHR